MDEGSPVNKRCRLSSPASNTSTGNGNAEKAFERANCRYDSSCYRRNENHLLQFRHPLLEEAFRQMEETDDFTKLPSGFDVRTGDASVILEQVNVLKDAGFTMRSQPVLVPSSSSSNTPSTSTSHKIESESASSNVPSLPATPAEKPKNSASTFTTPSKAFDNDALTQLFEERKRKMRESQNLLTKRLSESPRKDVDSQSPSPSRNPSSRVTMADKWESSCPFNVFLTKVSEIPDEKDGVLSASFPDLFDASFGEIKAVCHINFMIEATWFFNQTLEAGISSKPTWVIHGMDNEAELLEGAKAFPLMKFFRAKSPFPFGHHHTKMSLVQYTDLSVRFFIYTANLIESDWDKRSQGIWISPRCPRVPSGSPQSVGESKTNFRADISLYLSTYPPKASAAWKDVIKYVDCSEIKVYFVCSAPITAQSHLNGFQFGIKKMESILRKYDLDTEPKWPLNVQCSSIGTLGACAQDWLINEFGNAMTGKDKYLLGPLNLIYPSEQNVRDSFDGILGGGCLPYSAMTHLKQKWLYRHLYQWKADCSGRSRAVPHIKSYSRWSPDYTKMSWLLLTSANLSKAAWGRVNKDGSRLSVMSWEAGVLFIPELFGSSKYFTVTKSDNALRFPLYYDIPLVKFGEKDKPFFYEMMELAR